MLLLHVEVMQVRTGDGVRTVVVVEREAAVVISRRRLPVVLLLLRVVCEEIVFKRAPKVNETLLIFNVVCCDHASRVRLTVRAETAILLQVLLHLQIVEGVGEVWRDGAPVGRIESGRVVRVVRL